MKKAFDMASVGIFILLMLFIAAFPAHISELTKSGLKMCLSGAIPSIFIPMIISQLLTRTGITETVGILLSCVIKPIFGIKKELCGAFISGIVSGFPNGAHSVGLTYDNGKCTKSEAEMCLALSNNCSIPFFTSVIGLKVLNDVKLGIIIYVSSIICIIAEAFILRQIDKTKENQLKSAHCTQTSNNSCEISNAVCKSITSSCTSAVYITGFITFFYVISHLLSKCIGLNGYAGYLLSGFFELFSGVLSINSTSIYTKVALCSAMAGFSGISVIFQVTEAAHRYGLSVKNFIYTRILNIFLMPPTALCLTKVLHNKPRTTFNNYGYYLPTEDFSVSGIAILYAGAFFVVMLFFLIYLISLLKERKKYNYARQRINSTKFLQ